MLVSETRGVNNILGPLFGGDHLGTDDMIQFIWLQGYQIDLSVCSGFFDKFRKIHYTTHVVFQACVTQSSSV